MSEPENDLDVLDGQPEGEVDLTPGPMVQVPDALPVAATPMEMVGRALQQGITGDTLQQFMDLQERYEANEARKAYAAAMALCQKHMPAIVADSPNDQTSSLYAKLGKINQAIAPVYTKQGFSISFDEVPIEGDMIRIRARVIHRLGHVEAFTYDLPLDMGGIRGNENKTAVHAKGSTTTYARRYLTTMIFNLAIGDDLDGNLPGGGGGVDDDQTMKLNAMIAEWEITDPTPILREFGIDDWAKLPAKKFEKAVQRINIIGEQRSKRR